MKRVILVTGANRGIGLAAVKQLSLNSDDTILLGCRNIEDGKKQAEVLASNVLAVKIDLKNRETLKTDIQNILSTYKKIDVLVNNAGVLFKENFSDIDLDDFDQTMRVNMVAPFELIRSLAPEMKKNSYGRIVNVSSGWGSFNEGLEGPFVYSLSKASLNALTLTLSKELSENILINSACPGWVHTRMGGEEAPRTPEEGAQTIVWLANLPSDGPSGKNFRDKKEIKW